MNGQLAIPVNPDGSPVALTVNTSERSDGSLMLGRWDRKHRGRVVVRFDLGGESLLSFQQEMN